MSVFTSNKSTYRAHCQAFTALLSGLLTTHSWFLNSSYMPAGIWTVLSATDGILSSWRDRTPAIILCIVSGKPAYYFKDKRPHEDQSWFSLMMTLNVEKEQLTEFILFDRKRFHDIRFHNSEKLPSFKRIPLIRSPVLIGKCLIGLSKSRIER